MENKQEEKMKNVSNGNLVQDLKGEVEIKDSLTIEELTANDLESQQHEVSEIINDGCGNKPKDADSDSSSYDSDIILYMTPFSLISDDLFMGRMRRKNKFFSDRRYKEHKLVAAEMYKDPDLYLAAKNGDLDHFKRIFNRISRVDSNDDILARLSVIGNTFIHVAAKHGNQDIVRFIASKKPSLVLAKNFNAETALHLAAKGGDEPMVKALVEILTDNERKKRDLLMAKNKMGNTALHVALLSGWESIATYLIEQDSELSYHLNKHGESAIYLVAKAGLVERVSSFLEKCTDESRLNLLFESNFIQLAPMRKVKNEKKSPIQAAIEKEENKSPIQAAIERKDIVVLKAIIKSNPRLIQVRDSEGRNPLHIAACSGHLEATRYLLSECALNATRRDRAGKLPIHLAALEGHVDVIRFLLQDFPQPEELLDMAGRNILHNAVEKGRYNVVNFVLKDPNLNSLINMKDVSGDTPLHIASKDNLPKMVSILTWDKRVDIMAVNNKGMTALDVTYDKWIHNPSFTQHLTWAALKAASVPQRSDFGRLVIDHMEDYKERVNTLLVVATLVATITFAAGFTMPGGHISSETGTDLGMATMWRDTIFHVFVLCDTIAMYTSILVVTALIWTQLDDDTLVFNALKLAAPLVGVALVMMSIAFTAGITIAVHKLRWLQITLLAMSTSSIALLLLLLLPLCTPLTSRSRILRYLSYYPFCLLVLISSTKLENSDL